MRERNRGVGIVKDIGKGGRAAGVSGGGGMVDEMEDKRLMR